MGAVSEEIFDPEAGGREDLKVFQLSGEDVCCVSLLMIHSCRFC